MALPEVGVRAVVDNLSSFNRGVKQVQHGYDVLDDGATRVEKKSAGVAGGFLNLGDSMLGLGATAAKVAAGGIALLAGGLAAVAKVSIDVAKDFESQIAIMSVAVDSSTVSMEELSEAALMVGEDTSLVGVSATQAADAMTGLFKAGLDTTDVFGDLNGYLEGTTDLSGALRAAVDLQAASSLDLAAASDAVAVAMKTFGLSAEDATRISDSFVQSADASVAEVEGLVDGLKNVGPTAAAFGFTLEDTNNALAILSTRGIQGSEAGTALKSMLVNIQRPTKQVKEEMAKLGVELFDNQGNMKDLRSIVIELSNALSEDATVTERVGGASAKLTKAAEKARDKIPKLTTKISEQEVQLGILQQELANTIEKYGDTSIQAQKKRLAVSKLTNDIAENRQEYKEYQNAIGQYEAAASSATTVVRKMTEEERNAAVQTIAGTYGMKALQTLVAEGAVGWDAMAEATGAASSASEVAFARTNTLEGAMEALDGTVETLKIRIGSTLLPVLTDLARQFADFINENAPQITAAFESFATWLGEAIPAAIKMASDFWSDTLQPALRTVVGFIETKVIPAIEEIADWLGEQLPKVIAFINEHWEAFRAALIAIGAVLAGAAIAAGIASIAGAIAALANPVTLIIAAVGLLAAAWTEDWGGIRTFLTGVWNEHLKPIFDQLVVWLQENIPIAIAALASFWETTLQPALQTVWAFIKDKVIPILQDIAAWLGDNIPPLIEGLATLWKDVLLPAIEDVWGFLNESVFPLFEALGELLGAIVGKAVEALAGLWQNVLQPALQDVWAVLKEKLEPVLLAVAKFMTEIALPAFEKFGFFVRDVIVPVVKELVENWLGKLKDAFEGIKSALEPVIQFIKDLADSIKNLELPGWLTPGSPTPLEMGLVGIADVTKDTAGAIQELGRALGGLLGLGATQGVESVTDSLDSLFGVANRISSLGASFAQMFGQKEIDPLNKSISELEDNLAAIAEEREALLESGRADIATTTRLNQLDAEEAQMTAQMNEQLKERAKLEERITQLQERQQQLAFLQQQFELLRMIQDFGLDPGEVLGDIELGAGADPGKLMDVMSNALSSVIEQIDNLLATGDPEQIFEGVPAKTGEMWAFGDSIGGVLEATEGAANAFEGFLGALDEFQMPTELEPGSPSIFETVLATIAELLSNILVKALDLFSAAFNAAAESWTDKLEAVKAQIQDLYQNQFPLLQATVSSASASMIDSLNSIIQTLISLAEGTLPALAAAFNTTFTDAQTLIDDTEVDVLELIDTVVQLGVELTAIAAAGGPLEMLGNAFDDTFAGEGGATDLIQDASSAADVLATSLSGLPATLSGVKTAFQNAFTGANGATSVVNAAKNAVQDLINKLMGEGGLSDVVENVRSIWYDAWIKAAESVITAVAAVNAALEQTINLLETVGQLAGATGLALQEYLGGGAFAAPATQTVRAPVTTNNITNVFQLGGNTINSGLDEAILDARIRSIVASAIRTGK